MPAIWSDGFPVCAVILKNCSEIPAGPFVNFSAQTQIVSDLHFVYSIWVGRNQTMYDSYVPCSHVRRSGGNNSMYHILHKRNERLRGVFLVIYRLFRLRAPKHATVSSRPVDIDSPGVQSKSGIGRPAPPSPTFALTAARSLPSLS
jgi:hypothetical protein